jgi:hypothetical protein
VNENRKQWQLAIPDALLYVYAMDNTSQRSRGRPPVYKVAMADPVAVRLPAPVLAAIDRASKQQGTDRGHIMRRVLEEWARGASVVEFSNKSV